MTPESPEVLAARHLAEACHELRTPATVMSLVSELGLHADLVEPERVADVLEVVRRQAYLLRSLIDRYLEHGVLVERGWSDVSADVDLAVEVGDVLDSLLPLVPAERVHRDLRAASVFGDPGRVRSIVVNLVLNAVKYSPDHELVTVEVGLEGAEAVLHVADRGIGIPALERDRVLQPFQRATNARELAVAGVGLGLAIVANHVQALDGIMVVSDRPGGGTVMTVRLPASRTDSHGG